MIPILYASTETVKQLVADKTNGVGRLADATSCKVQEDRNGAFTLTMTYPNIGIHYADVVIGACIRAKPNDLADPQLFRIYHISKPLNGVVTIDAQHISYDLSKAVVKPFSAKGITAVTSGMISNMIGGIGFSFSSDINNGDSQFTNDHPQSFRALLGGQEGSVLDVFGGEYAFNNEKVILHAHRGSDNGVVIRYGKNLTSVQQDENIESTYTAVYPYVLNSDQETIAGDLQTVVSTSEPKILALDLSSEFKEEDGTPTAAQINAKAQEYIKVNNIGVPKVSLDVSFVQLWQTQEYKEIAPLERVSLCDTVTVKYEKLGVDAKAKVITTVYDVLAERYDSITLGDAKSSLASTIAAAPEREAIEKQTSSDLERAVTRATNLITGTKGGHVVIQRDASGKPEELLIMDTDDVATAAKVWRWNLGGLGYSNTGINGEYGTAITQDGEIVADFITTGDLNAQVITTGILKDRQSNNSWNLDTGELSLHAYETKTDASSKLTSANSHADSAASTAETNAKAYADAQIKVSAEGITADVSKTYETKTDAQKTKEELSSTITQTAAGIESKVEKKVDSDEYTGDTIVSKINQTAEEVKIEASHVAINGLLTITNSDGTKSITVPTKTSQLTNDSIKVPTKTSELTNDSGYVTSIDEDVYVTYADLAAKKAQASDYTEINGAKITTGEIDAVDIYSSSLTFGDTSNSYVEMRTNDAKTGGIIEGSGVIEFKTKGKFNAENQSTSGGNSASIIRMANDTVTVTNLDKASATNNRNYINLMNYLTTKASSEDSAYYSDLANSIYVTGNSEPSKGNTMKLQNYYYTDPAYTGNIIDIESSKHLGGTTKYDYNSIQMKNYYPGSSIYANGIFLWNNAYNSTDGFTGAKIALRNFNSSGKKENEIYLLERSGNPKILISNNNASEKAVNDIELNYNSGAPKLVISNRSAASVLCNQIDMEARTGNGNIFWYYNYDYSKNDGTTKANQMYIWSKTSGSNQAVIQNFSGGSEKNLLALYSSGTYGVVLKNIASTGKTSQLYFQNDGKIRLETNTGGTSFIQVSTNGNMDVQANNALVLKSENAYVTMQTVSATESGHIHRWNYKLGWCSVKGTDGNTYQALVGYESA